jgi:hypothetical protein
MKLKYRKPLAEVTTHEVKTSNLLEPSLIVELFFALVEKQSYDRIATLKVANYDIEPARIKLRARIASEYLAKVRAWTFHKLAKKGFANMSVGRNRQIGTLYFYRYLQNLVLREDWKDDSNAIGCPIIEHDFQIRFGKDSHLTMGPNEGTNFGKKKTIRNRNGWEYIIKQKQLAVFYKDHDTDWTALRPYQRKFNRYWNPKTASYWATNENGISGELADIF